MPGLPFMCGGRGNPEVFVFYFTFSLSLSVLRWIYGTAVLAGPTCSVSQGSAVTSVSHPLISEKHLKTCLCLHSPDCCHFDGGNWLPNAQSSFLLCALFHLPLVCFQWFLVAEVSSLSFLHCCGYSWVQPRRHFNLWSQVGYQLPREYSPVT